MATFQNATHFYFKETQSVEISKEKQVLKCNMRTSVKVQHIEDTDIDTLIWLIVSLLFFVFSLKCQNHLMSERTE